MNKKRGNYHRWKGGKICLNCGIERYKAGGVELFYRDGVKVGYVIPKCERVKGKDCSSFTGNHVKLIEEPYEPVEPVNEKRLEVWEICCEVFGCGKILTKEEKLFGSRCKYHNEFKTDDCGLGLASKFPLSFKKRAVGRKKKKVAVSV